MSDTDRDVNTMKERASKNQQFIYIKIPEVPVCFSYKVVKLKQQKQPPVVFYKKSSSEKIS